MRPAVILTLTFGLLAVTVFSLGVWGVFESASVLWRTSWPLAALVQASLALAFGYYVAKTGGLS